MVQKTKTKVPNARLGKAAPKPLGLKKFCGKYKVARSDLTRLTGYSQRSVDKWAAGDLPGKSAQLKWRETTRLFDALADIMQPGDIGEWLKSPNEAFEGSTPLQVIERGEGDRIWRMLYLVESGEPV